MPVKCIEWNEELFRNDKADMKFEIYFSDGSVEEFYADINTGKDIREKLRKGMLTQLNSEIFFQDNVPGNIDLNGYVIYLKHVKMVKYYHRRKEK